MSDLIDDETLGILQRACDRATPGPWNIDYSEYSGKMCVDGISSPGQCEDIVKTDSGVYGPCDADARFISLARTEMPKLLDEVRQLRALINSPRIDEFFAAVRIEAAHQVERWGVEHDAGKRPEDWLTLYTYLLGKAAKAHFDGDRDKLLHHIITVAAVAMNWHRNATGENTRMRAGVAP